MTQTRKKESGALTSSSFQRKSCRTSPERTTYSYCVKKGRNSSAPRRRRTSSSRQASSTYASSSLKWNDAGHRTEAPASTAFTRHEQRRGNAHTGLKVHAGRKHEILFI